MDKMYNRVIGNFDAGYALVLKCISAHKVQKRINYSGKTTKTRLAVVVSSSLLLHGHGSIS